MSKSKQVSIHLMLLFITEQSAVTIKQLKFQYISCCYLSEKKSKKIFGIQVSIHLMLLFIPWMSITARNALTVSIHLMLLFIFGGVPILWICIRFNTSHVVIYLIRFMHPYCFWVSFNTSHVVIYHIDKHIRHCKGHQFQYISCCYLSNILHIIVFISPSFNTSHVVIYHLIFQENLLTVSSFNTSHVVIYQCRIFDSPPTRLFQYISCCYLSEIFFPFSIVQM